MTQAPSTKWGRSSRIASGLVATFVFIAGVVSGSLSGMKADMCAFYLFSLDRLMLCKFPGKVCYLSVHTSVLGITLGSPQRTSCPAIAWIRETPLEISRLRRQNWLWNFFVLRCERNWDSEGCPHCSVMGSCWTAAAGPHQPLPPFLYTRGTRSWQIPFFSSLELNSHHGAGYKHHFWWIQGFCLEPVCALPLVQGQQGGASGLQ